MQSHIQKNFEDSIRGEVKFNNRPIGRLTVQSCLFNSDTATTISSVVGDERQLTGTDTLTNEPSVKITRERFQGKTDVVVVSHTQTEYASEHGFAPNFTEQPKVLVL